MTKSTLAFGLAALLLSGAAGPALADFSFGTAMSKITREARSAVETAAAGIDDAFESDDGAEEGRDEEGRDEDDGADADDRDDDSDNDNDSEGGDSDSDD